MGPYKTYNDDAVSLATNDGYAKILYPGERWLLCGMV
jgi:hypothetical protein